jgi:hypothetical protein
VNEEDARAVFERIAPELDHRERVVRAAEPELRDDEVLDRALRHALAQLRYEVSRETFAFLRWKAGEVRAAALRTGAAVAAARQERAEGRAYASERRVQPGRGPTGGGREPPRRYYGRDGTRWTVREVEAGGEAWAHAPRCLVFESEGAIRRVWRYPADWLGLSDAELDALSWQV